MNLERDLELMYEIGTMRYISRTWKQFGGVDFANLAEHTLRVVWISMLISKYEKADISKVIQLALIHDLAETRTGDVNYLTRMYTKRDENKALNDIVKNTSFEEEIKSLWVEYENRLTLEAKIVKDADTLDCDIELQETEASGSKIKNVLSETRKATYKKLNTNTAKKLFQEIVNSNPHSWHINGINRFNSGDWNLK